MPSTNSVHKIDLEIQEEVKSINPVASMNSKTENNNSHKIDLNSHEKVKSILPVTAMNTSTENKLKRTYTKKPKIVVEEEPDVPTPEPAVLMNDGIDTSPEEEAYKEGVEEEEDEEETEDEEEPEVFVSDMNDGIDTSPEEEAYAENCKAQHNFAMNTTTENNNSHKIDLHNQEEVNTTTNKPEKKYIYMCSWFETKRHRISHTNMYFEKAEDTNWIFDTPEWFLDLVRIEYICVMSNTKEYSMAQNSK